MSYMAKFCRAARSTCTPLQCRASRGTKTLKLCCASHSRACYLPFFLTFRLESRAVRSRERTCAREAERSETSRRRFNFQHGGAEWCSASPRRRRHQQAAPAGQGARLLRRRGRQPLPGLRGRGRRRHLAAGATPPRPRRRVDASGAALARCWLVARWSARTPWATSAAPSSGASGGGL